MNLSAPFLCQFFKDQVGKNWKKKIFLFYFLLMLISKMASVLPFTDIVFGNETEAAAYAEVKKNQFLFKNTSIKHFLKSEQ